MEENTTVSEEIIEENSEISSEDLQADILENVSAVATDSNSNGTRIIAPEIPTYTLTESNDLYNGHKVYYTEYGGACYYDANGNICWIYDYDSIVEGGAVEMTTEEITSEESTVEESTTEEIISEEFIVEEITTEETTEDSTEILEIYTEVPFLEKPLNEYSVSEGLLLLIFILGILAFVYHIIFD